MLSSERLEELVENSGLSFKKTKISYIFTCPRCSKKEKLSMYRETGRFICYYCDAHNGFSGKPEFALSEMLGMSIAEVKSILYGQAFKPEMLLDVKLKDPYGQIEEEDQEFELPQVTYEADMYGMDHPWALPGLKYLQKRGIDADTALDYGLRYWVSKRRVVFPVYGYGRLLGYQARATFPTEYYDGAGELRTVPKMLSSNGLPREHTVMFANKLEGHTHCVITEGPIDAIACRLAGGAIATMGKAVSQGQIAFIKSTGVKKVYLALDPDAQKNMAYLTKQFEGLEVYLMKPTQGYKDFGEMNPEAVLEIFKTAPRVDSSHLFVHLDKF